MDDLMCEWRDRPFTRPNTMGRPPKFCCAAHRQRAYEMRRLEGIEAENARLRVVVERFVGFARSVGTTPTNAAVDSMTGLLAQALESLGEEATDG